MFKARMWRIEGIAQAIIHWEHKYCLGEGITIQGGIKWIKWEDLTKSWWIFLINKINWRISPR